MSKVWCVLGNFTHLLVHRPLFLSSSADLPVTVPQGPPAARQLKNAFPLS